jgi:sugar phosphate isomerase/epimerase
MKYAVIISDGTFPCNTAPLQGPLEDCFRRAAELGFDGVQLTVKDPQELDPAELNALCRQYGLCVSGLATGQIYTKDGFGMGCGEETRRKTAVRRLSQWLDVAAEIGHPSLIIGAVRGRLADAPTPAIYYRQFRKSMEELVAHAEQKKTPVILEVNDTRETEIYCDPDETFALVNSFHSPYCSMYLDTMHLAYEQYDLTAVLEKYALQVPQIDISGEDRCAPYQSSIDFAHGMVLLKKLEYPGWLTFEIRPDSDLQRALAYIRSF